MKPGRRERSTLSTKSGGTPSWLPTTTETCFLSSTPQFKNSNKSNSEHKFRTKMNFIPSTPWWGSKITNLCLKPYLWSLNFTKKEANTLYTPLSMGWCWRISARSTAPTSSSRASCKYKCWVKKTLREIAFRPHLSEASFLTSLPFSASASLSPLLPSLQSSS